MDIQTAIQILKKWIEFDRDMRATVEDITGYDEFCETVCVAIETVLEVINKKQSTIDYLRQQAREG